MPFIYSFGNTDWRVASAYCIGEEVEENTDCFLEPRSQKEQAKDKQGAGHTAQARTV